MSWCVDTQSSKHTQNLRAPAASSAAASCAAERAQFAAALSAASNQYQKDKTAMQDDFDKQVAALKSKAQLDTVSAVKSKQGEFDRQVNALKSQTQSDIAAAVRAKQNEFDVQFAALKNRAQSEKDDAIRNKQNEFDGQVMLLKAKAQSDLDNVLRGKQAQHESELAAFRGKAQSDLSAAVKNKQNECDVQLAIAQAKAQSELAAVIKKKDDDCDKRLEQKERQIKLLHSKLRACQQKKDKYEAAEEQALDWNADTQAPDQHQVYVDEEGTLWGFGSNSEGQLGYDPSFLYGTIAPTALAQGYRFLSAVTGKRHTLAIREDGTVWACGSNEYGQLGYEPDENAFSSEWIQVSGLTNIIQVATGEQSCVALDEYGTAYVWGQGQPVQEITPEAEEQVQFSSVGVDTDKFYAIDLQGQTWDL